MGKYSPYVTNTRGAAKKGVHPIWRGIGFVMIILIPVLAYGATLLFLQENRANGWFQIPPDLIAKGFSDQMLYMKIIGTVVFSLVFYAIFNLVSFIILSIFAPPRYGPYDVPPVAYRGRKNR